MLKTIKHETPIEAYNTGTCTVNDLIKAYGMRAESPTFCKECDDYKTCGGIKKSTCRYRKWYIENEINNPKRKNEPVKYVRMSKEQKARVADMYRKGYRVCDIAKITGISGQTIQSNVRKLDDFRYVKNPTDWSQHDKAIINQMKKGVIYRKIGEQLGLTRMQVYARVTKLKRIGAIKDIDYRKEGERMVRNVRR